MATFEVIQESHYEPLFAELHPNEPVWKKFTIKATKMCGNNKGEVFTSSYFARNFPEIAGWCAFYTAIEREGSIAWQRGLAQSYEVIF